MQDTPRQDDHPHPKFNYFDSSVENSVAQWRGYSVLTHIGRAGVTGMQMTTIGLVVETLLGDSQGMETYGTALAAWIAITLTGLEAEMFMRRRAGNETQGI